MDLPLMFGLFEIYRQHKIIFYSNSKEQAGRYVFINSKVCLWKRLSKDPIKSRLVNQFQKTFKLKSYLHLLKNRIIAVCYLFLLAYQFLSKNTWIYSKSNLKPESKKHDFSHLKKSYNFLARLDFRNCFLAI